ncbi:uracil-DNA glycosylase family protein [Nannocystis pusilla]|uniref:Single-stranded DNA-binding protein n=1 Tax=Nannocystis pusilla TaxID=889268 RepID=A0ABS7TMZ8_9BACT|nr:uracil-DNA glycosylase family protein [Nannocystis pusilla]MBZ5709612.1 single-stranded DNA-binding protein [Nannocystis pusilla]
MTISAELQAAARRLADEVRDLRFSEPIAFVYHPLDYAWAPHAAYIAAYGRTRKDVVFLGMNPGPFGMTQTGVPFGEVKAVRDFLKIEAPVARPDREHPARPVQGFACTRAEVSGSRLWGAVAQRWATAERFFNRHYVANYCPLTFIAAGGANFTPDKLPAAERAPLEAACDRHLLRLVELLEPKWVIGIGGFAEKRAQKVVGGRVQVGRVLHPSPRSPMSNQGWAEAAAADLTALGVCPLSDLAQGTGPDAQGAKAGRGAGRAAHAG